MFDRTPQIRTTYQKGGRFHVYTTATQTKRHRDLRDTFPAITAIGHVVNYPNGMRGFVVHHEIANDTWADVEAAYEAEMANR